jgi:hypothetical protein
MWSIDLLEEHTLHVFENEVLRIELGAAAE